MRKAPEREQEIDGMTEGQLREFVSNPEIFEDRKQYAQEILDTLNQLCETVRD